MTTLEDIQLTLDRIAAKLDLLNSPAATTTATAVEETKFGYMFCSKCTKNFFDLKTETISSFTFFNGSLLCVECHNEERIKYEIFSKI